MKKTFLLTILLTLCVTSFAFAQEAKSWGPAFFRENVTVANDVAVGGDLSISESLTVNDGIFGTNLNLTNDAGYLLTEVDGSVTNEIQGIDSVLAEDNATSIDLSISNDLTVEGKIYGSNSEMTNDAGFLTAEVDGSITNEIQTFQEVCDEGSITTTDLSVGNDMTVDGTLYTSVIDSNEELLIFGTIPVGDTTDGKRFKVQRYAPEGTDAFDFYFSEWRVGFVTSTQGMSFQTAVGEALRFQVDGGSPLYVGSHWNSVDGIPIRLFSYNTGASAVKYVDVQLVDDELEITREDANIKGTTIGMDVTTSGTFYMTNVPTSDPGVSGAVWSDSGTLKIST